MSENGATIKLQCDGNNYWKPSVDVGHNLVRFSSNEKTFAMLPLQPFCVPNPSMLFNGIMGKKI